MSGGGSGGSGEQKYLWNDDMAPLWRDALGRATGMMQDKYQYYDPGKESGFSMGEGPFGTIGPTGWFNDTRNTSRVAGINADQQRAIGGIRYLANYGTDDSQSASDVISRNMTWNNSTNQNLWSNSPIQTERNMYSGMDNPYFDKTLDVGTKKITDAYKRGTDVNTTRMANLQGSFGGSAHQDAVKNNEEALAEQLGNYTAGMQNDQYNRSAGLEDSYQNRNFQGQQFDKQIGSSNYENQLARQMQAAQMGFGTEDLAFNRFKNLMGVGDAQRSYEQQLKDMTYSNWIELMNFPKSNMDWYTGLLGRAQGGVAPNVQTSYPSTAISPFSALLAAGAAYKGFGDKT